DATPRDPTAISYRHAVLSTLFEVQSRLRDQTIVRPVSRVIEKMGHVGLFHPPSEAWPQKVLQAINLGDFSLLMLSVEFRDGETVTVEVADRATEDISKEAVNSRQENRRIGIEDLKRFFGRAVEAQVEDDKSNGSGIGFQKDWNILFNRSDIKFRPL